MCVTCLPCCARAVLQRVVSVRKLFQVEGIRQPVRHLVAVGPVNQNLHAKGPHDLKKHVSVTLGVAHSEGTG